MRFRRTPIVPSHSRRALVVAAIALLAAGCAVNPRPRAGVVYVQQGPPPRVVEVIGPAPSRAHVWVPGHHEWRGGSYVWIAGRYEQPAAGFRRYEPGRWVHTRSGWYWTDGRWR